MYRSDIGIADGTRSDVDELLGLIVGWVRPDVRLPLQFLGIDGSVPIGNTSSLPAGASRTVRDERVSHEQRPRRREVLGKGDPDGERVLRVLPEALVLLGWQLFWRTKGRLDRRQLGPL
jgi:hypothetical protein